MKLLIVVIIAAGIVWYFGFYSENAFFRDYSGESGYFMGNELQR